MTPTREVDAELPWWRRGPAPARQTLALGPLVFAAAVAGLLLAGGRVTASVCLLVAAALFTHARAVSPSRMGRLEQRLDAGAGWLGRVLSRALLGVVYALVFLPAAAFLGARRRLPLRPRPARSWTQRPTAGALPRVERAYGFEPGRDRRSARFRVRLGAALAAFVLLDVATGAVLAGSGVLPPADRGQVKDAIGGTLSTLMAGPVFADEPWAPELARDLAAFELEPRSYQPFVVRRFAPFSSTYVNTTDQERVSYQQDAGDADPIDIAFFGGSVLFGVGQRDEHTIPSELARIAEQDGVAVEVHNYGLPGLTLFQEYLQLESLLASGHRFDAVVFLDGFNEFVVQLEQPSSDPTHLGVDVMQSLTAQFGREQYQDPGYASGIDELRDAYHRSSATWRLVDHLRGRTPHLSDRVPPVVTEDQVRADALAIYGRAQGLVRSLTEGTDVAVTFFWQPRQGGWDESLLDDLPAGTVDVSSAFGDDASSYYYDHVHTNEAGAHRLAAALWEQLRPTLGR